MIEDLSFMKCKEHNVKYPSHLECPGCKKEKEEVKEKEEKKELNPFQRAVLRCIKEGSKLESI